MVPQAQLVLFKILVEGQEGPQLKAALAYAQFLYPLAPLLEPLKRSRGYRIPRLEWMAEEDQLRKWRRAIDRGQSILG